MVHHQVVSSTCVSRPSPSSPFSFLRCPDDADRVPRSAEELRGDLESEREERVGRARKLRDIVHYCTTFSSSKLSGLLQ